VPRFLVTGTSRYSLGDLQCTLFYLGELTKADRELLESSLYDWHERTQRGPFGLAYKTISPVRFGSIKTQPVAQWDVELRDPDEQVIDSMVAVLNHVEQLSATRSVELVLGGSDDVPFVLDDEVS